MHCFQCGNQLPPDSLFCQYCGADLRQEARCPACGKTLQPDMKFCPYCGSSTAAAAGTPAQVEAEMAAEEQFPNPSEAQTIPGAAEKRPDPEGETPEAQAVPETEEAPDTPVFDAAAILAGEAAFIAPQSKPASSPAETAPGHAAEPAPRPTISPAAREALFQDLIQESQSRQTVPQQTPPRRQSPADITPDRGGRGILILVGLLLAALVVLLVLFFTRWSPASRPETPENATEAPTQKATEKPTETGHVHTLKMVVDREATCAREGAKHWVCKTCDDYHGETVTIPKTGHSYTTKTVKAATCTAAGQKQSVCTVCGATAGTTSIPATGHSYTAKDTTPATCSSSGVRTHTCSGCGSSYTEAIAALGHNFPGLDYTSCKDTVACTRCSTTQKGTSHQLTFDPFSGYAKCSRCQTIDYSKIMLTASTTQVRLVGSTPKTVTFKTDVDDINSIVVNYDENYVYPIWGTWKGNSIDLKLYPMRSGSTTVQVYLKNMPSVSRNIYVTISK